MKIEFTAEERRTIRRNQSRPQWDAMYSEDVNLVTNIVCDVLEMYFAKFMKLAQDPEFIKQQTDIAVKMLDPVFEELKDTFTK